jgi:Spy/CpxP family protein refolding chaperone
MRTSVNKILLFLTVALLALNIVLAYFLWKGKNHPGRDRNSDRGDWVVEELKLNDEQKAEHKKLKDAHFANLKPVFDSINAYRKRLYSELKDSVTNDSLVNYYTTAIGNKHAEISRYTFDHFKKIRSLCTPDQKLKLDTLVQKIVQNMGKRGGKSKPGTNK